MQTLFEKKMHGQLGREIPEKADKGNRGIGYRKGIEKLKQRLDYAWCQGIGNSNKLYQASH